MVYHHRQQQQQQQQKKIKGDDEEAQLHHHHQQEDLMRLLLLHEHLTTKKPTKAAAPLLLLFLSLFLLLSTPKLLLSPCKPPSHHLSLLFPHLPRLKMASFPLGSGPKEPLKQQHTTLPCSNTPNNTMCCDRTSSHRTDVCVMKGDVRLHPSSDSIHLYGSEMKEKKAVERIRPYTRKWEGELMATVDELQLVATDTNDGVDRCDVRHNVTAVVFSTGGYTGNVYHEFNDGLIPLFITAGHLNRKVVFVILEYHNWWFSKYADVLSQLSDYPIVDFANDKRSHCFPEAIVGLRIHDELSIDHLRMPSPNATTIHDFKRLLDRAYARRIRLLERAEAEAEEHKPREEPPEPSIVERPRLLIVSRNGSRGIENEAELVELCEEIGFQVDVLRPDRTTELAKIYRAMNASDAMIGVHGAAMTHLLFMQPKAVFVQVIPLGTEWAANTYYGEPAKKMGLKYIPYKILPRESSLYDKYPKDDPILRDPSSITAKGWKFTKEVYLNSQSVRLDLNRLLKRLTRVYHYTVSRRNQMEKKWDWSWQLPLEAQREMAKVNQAWRMRR